MTDTNSKAQVTEEAIRKAGKVVIDHMADNGLTYEAVAQELTDCLMRIVDPDFIAALAAQEKPEPDAALQAAADANGGYINGKTKRIVMAAINAIASPSQEAHRHAVALRQCSLFAADVGEHIVKAMVDAADFLDGPALAAQEKPEPGVAVPAGWKLVPVEPTSFMIASAISVDWRRGEDVVRLIWQKMLSDAPSPDLPEGEVETPAPSDNLRGRWRVIEAATAPGYWGIELADAGNDDDAIMYPQKIHRDTVARIVEAHNAAITSGVKDDDPCPGEHQEVLDAINSHNYGEEA